MVAYVEEREKVKAMATKKKTERKIQIKVRPDWIWTLQLNCRKPIPKAFDSSGSYTTSKREAYLKGVFEVSSCMFEKDSCKTVLTFSPVLKKKLCWVLSRIVKMVTAMTYEAKHAKSLNLEVEEKSVHWFRKKKLFQNVITTCWLFAISLINTN